MKTQMRMQHFSKYLSIILMVLTLDIFNFKQMALAYNFFQANQLSSDNIGEIKVKFI
jgi:hypothetical protein